MIIIIIIMHRASYVPFSRKDHTRRAQKISRESYIIFILFLTQKNHSPRPVMVKETDVFFHLLRQFEVSLVLMMALYKRVCDGEHIYARSLVVESQAISTDSLAGCSMLIKKITRFEYIVKHHLAHICICVLHFMWNLMVSSISLRNAFLPVRFFFKRNFRY